MTFEDVVDKMCGYLRRLKSSELITRDARGRFPSAPTLPMGKGVYVFYEDCKPLYVGRTNGVRKRILDHGKPRGRHNSATFAFILAKKEFELACPNCKLSPDLFAQSADDSEILTVLKQHVYERRNDKVKHPHSKERDDLEKDPEFKSLYDGAKGRVRNMGVRVVEIEDDIEQAIFEIYAHMELGTPYNTFENH